MTTQATSLEKVNQPAAPLALADKPNSLARMDLRELKQLAEIMVASGAFEDVKDVAKAQVKIMAGAELGFSPLVSMTGIHFFKGKVVIGSNLIASLIKESPKYDYEVVEHTTEACAVQFYRVHGAFRSALGPAVRYTIAEAKAAGLTTKDTWQKYPADLLFAAVMRQGSRRHCADILRGVSAETEENFNSEPVVTIPAGHPMLPSDTAVVNGELVDTATGDVIDDKFFNRDSDPTAAGYSPVAQNAPANTPDSGASDDARSDEALSPSAVASAVTDDTPESEIVGWIDSLAKVKFGSDQAEIEKFLKGRNPAVMPRAALIKLHGELAAL